MNINSTLMINNTVKLAKKQLEMHEQQGPNSPLSIYEVARLMDTINGYNEIKEINENSIFFGFSHN